MTNFAQYQNEMNISFHGLTIFSKTFVFKILNSSSDNSLVPLLVMKNVFPLLSTLMLFACSSSFDNKLAPVDNPEMDPNEVDDDGDGFTEIEGDCDDENPAVNPGEVELCDGIDNNCDGDIDEDLQLQFYLDQDGDGFGNEDEIVNGCFPELGLSTIGGDCNGHRCV